MGNIVLNQENIDNRYMNTLGPYPLNSITPFYSNPLVTVYDCDFRTVELPTAGLVITDPPYNIGFDYDIYRDNLPDNDYIKMISELGAFTRVVIIHYPEETAKFVIPALGPAQHYSSWCYNAPIPRRFRLISYYGCTPDYSRIKQPYKNLKDKRIKLRLAEGSKGAGLYEWWNDIELVKNVSPEKKNGHPCPIPTSLAKRLIILCANPGDTIIDPFAGSLTVLKAAQDLSYKSIGCEISQDYIKAAIPRLAQMPIL